MAQNTEENAAEAILAEAERRATEAFDVFDLEGNKTIDIREMEEELMDILAEVEDEEPSDYVKFDKFLPVVTKILLEHRYRPASEAHLSKAFELLDKEGRGYLTEDELTNYMTSETEPFSPEEIEELVSAAVDAEKKLVNYKEFIQLLTVDQFELAGSTPAS